MTSPGLKIIFRKTVAVIKRDGVVGLLKRVLHVVRRLFMEWLYPNVDEVLAVFYVLQGKVTHKKMVDVGAHYGFALKPFLDDDFEVIAFEPDDENFCQLRKNFPESEHPNLRVDRRAVLDEARSSVSFFRSPVSSGISGLSEFHDSHQEAGLVDTVRLDAVLANAGWGDFDFLKIDTEGFDFFAIQSMDFSLGVPSVIVCEFEDRKTLPLGYRWQNMADHLVDSGFEVLVSEWYPIKEYGKRHRFRSIKRYPCSLEDVNGWGNLIATREAELMKQGVLEIERQLGK